jgi:site-specific DNA-methyltransferase (adenine-specific)
MKGSAPFSSESDEWGTPQKLFDRLNDEFHFNLDAAASSTNGKCPVNLTDNSLFLQWHEYKTIWLNPPYSRISDFIGKAYSESLKGAIVVCLIPSRIDTRYWHDYVMRASEIRFIQGRLKFNDLKGSAPFPSCIVVFRGDRSGAYPTISSMARDGDDHHE